MNWVRRSIVWKLVLPVPIALLVGIVAVFIFVPSMVASNVRSDAVRSAEQMANQFKTIRAYYTNNVIKKVVANGSLKPSFNHKDESNGVPLPATFIHDMSELLAKEDVSIRLYSPFPFPNRGDRQLDAFQSAAWEALKANPEQPFVREEAVGGTEVVRVAVADRMVADACVSCHNSHPQSPKVDWQRGDVRGVLEIVTSVEKQLAAGT